MLEIIAEIGSTHCGGLDNAIQLIQLARQAGATGVKFQCFEPVRLAERRVKHPRITKIDWPGKPKNYDRDTVLPALTKLYEDTHMPREWFPDLIPAAKSEKLTWHSSVFDIEDIKFLETMNCPRYKIASFEAHDHDVMSAAVAAHKPLIVSVTQIEDLMPTPYFDITVLHATNYGVSAKQANLGRMRWWHDGKVMNRNHWPWGISDHTITTYAAEIGVTLGACMVEWHLMLPDVRSPDDNFAHTPSQFKYKAARLRDIYGALNG